MSILFSNNASTTLAAGISDTATTMTVATGDGALFPTISGGADYFLATLVASNGDLEIVKVTARSTDTFTIERAQEGTVAKAFSLGATVENRMTAGSFDTILDTVASVEGLPTPVDEQFIGEYDSTAGSYPSVTKEEFRTSIGAAPGVNILDNANFQINQYGLTTSYTTVSNGDYFVDRWRIEEGGASNPEVRYTSAGHILLSCTATQSGSARVEQEVINPSRYAGQILTVSARVKTISDNAYLTIADGVSFTSTAIVGDGTWQEVSATLTVDATPTALVIRCGAITDQTVGDTLEVENLKLEVGSVASAFEIADYALDLAECQRYYQPIPVASFSGMAVSATEARMVPTGFVEKVGATAAALDGGTYTCFVGSNTGKTFTSITGGLYSTGASGHIKFGGFTGLTTGDAAVGLTLDGSVIYDANL